MLHLDGRSLSLYYLVRISQVTGSNYVRCRERRVGVVFFPSPSVLSFHWSPGERLCMGGGGGCENNGLPQVPGMEGNQLATSLHCLYLNNSRDYGEKAWTSVFREFQQTRRPIHTLPSMLDITYKHGHLTRSPWWAAFCLSLFIPPRSRCGLPVLTCPLLRIPILKPEETKWTSWNICLSKSFTTLPPTQSL